MQILAMILDEFNCPGMFLLKITTENVGRGTWYRYGSQLYFYDSGCHDDPKHHIEDVEHKDRS